MESLKWGGLDNVTWSNWAPGEEVLLDPLDCGMGHVDVNHTWTGENCGSGSALPLCQIEGKRE